MIIKNLGQDAHCNHGNNQNFTILYRDFQIFVAYIKKICNFTHAALLDNTLYVITPWTTILNFELGSIKII